LTDANAQITTLKDTVKSQDTRIKSLEDEQAAAATAPTITGFSPTTGTSGTSVVITGTAFTGASAVSFGGTAASSFTVNSATQITAIVDGGSAGAVVVTTSGGTASYGTFTYTGIVTPPTSGVTVEWSPKGTPFTLVQPNNITVTITNATSQPIFGGTLTVKVQYLSNEITPTSTPLVFGGDVAWASGATVVGPFLTKVGSLTTFYAGANGGAALVVIPISVSVVTANSSFIVTEVKYIPATY